MREQWTTGLASLFPASYVATIGVDLYAIAQLIIVAAIALTNAYFKNKSSKPPIDFDRLKQQVEDLELINTRMARENDDLIQQRREGPDPDTSLADYPEGYTEAMAIRDAIEDHRKAAAATADRSVLADRNAAAASRVIGKKRASQRD